MIKEAALPQPNHQHQYTTGRPIVVRIYCCLSDQGVAHVEASNKIVHGDVNINIKKDDAGTKKRKRVVCKRPKESGCSSIGHSAGGALRDRFF